MTIEWYDNAANGRPSFISTDRFNRMHISSGTRAMLGVEEGKAISLYVGYDATTKQIAVIRTDAVKLKKIPMRFDGNRYYAPAGGFLERHQLPRKVATRYRFAGKDEKSGAFLFQLDDQTPDE